MKKIIILAALLISSHSFAEKFSMRDCALLPVTDTAGHALGYRVYERVEEYLKDSNWCDYKSTAALLSIFSKYRERLANHLKDPKVLRTVIDKLRIGSLFRIDMKFQVNQVELTLDILGENGIDLYFKEKIVIDNANVENVSQEIIKWFELYEESIPYDGQVIGVLGDQLTFKIAGNKKKGIGQNFKIKRYRNKTRHKLLNTVVEWDFDELAEGKVFNKDSKQALGIIKIYNSNKKVRPGDWIKLEKMTAAKIMSDKNFEEAKEKAFGRLGHVNIHAIIGSSSVGTSPKSGSIKMSGLTYGFSADAEAWITRKYFATAQFSRSIGTLSKKSGSPDLSSPSYSGGVIKVTGGYKYLPLGFFYGPQINFYGGYAHYSYNIERSDIDGFGSNSISGILLGVGGSMPLQKGARIFAKGEVMPFSSFNDDDDVFGSEKKSSSLHFNIGGSYKYAQNITLLGGLDITSNTGKFGGSISEVTYRDTIFQIGTRFVF
jgi:hypothetical protein